jgi:hypothetical protein
MGVWGGGVAGSQPMSIALHMEPKLTPYLTYGNNIALDQQSAYLQIFTSLCKKKDLSRPAGGGRGGKSEGERGKRQMK